MIVLTIITIITAKGNRFILLFNRFPSFSLLRYTFWLINRVIKNTVMLFILWLPLPAKSQAVKQSWTTNPFEQKVFIENKGQFDKKIICPEAIYNMRYQMKEWKFILLPKVYHTAGMNLHR